MATAAVALTPTWAAVQAGPESVLVQRQVRENTLIRVATTATQAADAAGIMLTDDSIHRIDIPTGSSLYARTVTAAAGSIVALGMVDPVEPT